MLSEFSVVALNNAGLVCVVAFSESWHCGVESLNSVLGTEEFGFSLYS
uniref:Uncharacterized protein n=1 Tax=Arundo donax TaxID=35708 RepID=A0A0A9AEF6_ARUDO